MITPKYAPVTVGSRYGRWTVTKISYKKYNHQQWECKCECGQSAIIDGASLKNGNSKSCGCRRVDVGRALPRRSESRLWRGGRHLKNGYMVIYAPEHPAAVSRKYVAEHRLVMEAHLGRFLLKEEFVHHINGVRHDNRLENLELWSRHHPQGQRVPDLVEWAHYIIKTYGHLHKNKLCKKQSSSPTKANKSRAAQVTT